jgi:hypothetical protein
MVIDQVHCLPSVFFNSSMYLSIFYVIKNKITVFVFFIIHIIYILQIMYKSVYSMGDLRYFEGNSDYTWFWEYEASLEHNPCMRCISTVATFFALEVETKYSCINTTCSKLVSIFALFWMSEQKFQTFFLTTTNRFWVGCLVIRDINFMGL